MIAEEGMPISKKSCGLQSKCSPNLNPSHSLLFYQCAEMVLPWLTPIELATISLTCKTLSLVSQSINACRSSDASRSFENFPVPFHNPVDHHPYSFFLYTPSHLISSSASLNPLPQRQPWGFNSFIPPEPPLAKLQFLVDDTGSGCHCHMCTKSGDHGCPCVEKFNGVEDVVGECGPSCRCGLHCDNRLTQFGISVHLKIVKDRRKGWGLYADQFISQGCFICEYAGAIFIPFSFSHN